MDEWLSAGDAAFIEKVNSKLKDILLTTKDTNFSFSL